MYFAILIVGQLVIAENAPCRAEDFAIARAAEQLFLDPTAEKSKALQSRLGAVSKDCWADFDEKVLFEVEPTVSLQELQGARTQSADCAEWSLLESKYAKRSELLMAALSSVRSDVQLCAIDAAAPLPDPRTWSPVDVAVLIDELRMLETPMRVFSQDGTLIHPRNERDPPALFDQILDRLDRLGRQRLWDVWQPRYIPKPGEHRWYREGGQKFNYWTASPPHFPGEGLLCTEDWLVEHEWLRGEAESHRTEINDYCGERWKQVDDAAPHPEMESVRAALRSLLDGRAVGGSNGKSP